MSTAARIQIIVISTTLSVCLLVAQARANDLWPPHQGGCDSAAFGDPGSAKLSRIDECTRLWFAYHSRGAVNGQYGDLVKEAVRRLYIEGSDEQAHLARQVLIGLQVTSLPARAAAGASAKSALAKREKCDVPKPDKAAIKAANKAFKKGMKFYKKENYEGALGHFTKMVEVAPGFPKSQYNTAAMYAMTDNEAEMVKHLYCLRDIGTSDAIKALRKARSDSDFARIRARSAAFKAITGYARIKIGNSLGEYGEDNVDNLEGMLEALGYPAPTLTETDKPYLEPHIWYRLESRTAAYMVAKLMAHPRTRTHLIDWDEKDFDVIVAWGDKVKKGDDPKVYVPDPADAEDALVELNRQSDEALRKPEQFAQDVEDTLGKPQEAIDSVTDSVNRAADTVDKVKGAVDTLLNPSLGF